MKKVSIIITNYKNEEHLENSIRSCLMQTYKDIEIIVVDDNSNPGKCFDIIKSFNSNKIRLIHTSRNYGHYMCCNFAIDASYGQYITFVGADDAIGKNHIKLLLSSLLSKRRKAVAAIGLYQRVGLDGHTIGGLKLCEASLLFPKDDFIRDIGYFHPVRFAGDSEYRLRAQAFYGRKIYNTNKNTYRALYRKGSLTRKANTKSGSPPRASYVREFKKLHKESKKDRDTLRFDYKKDCLQICLHKDIRVENFDLKTFTEVRLW